MTLTNVNIFVKAPARDKSIAVIYTNDKNVTQKELTIIMNDSTIDTKEADGKLGILITGGTKANITLNNSSIETKNVVRSASSAVPATAIYEQTAKSSTIVLNGTSSLKTVRHNGAELVGRAATKVDNFTDNTTSNVNQLSATNLEEESQEMVTLTLQVPKNLFELLKAWIQQFADEYNWNIQW